MDCYNWPGLGFGSGLSEGDHIPYGIFDPDDYPVAYSGEAIQFDNLAQIAPLPLQLDCDESRA